MSAATEAASLMGEAESLFRRLDLMDIFYEYLDDCDDVPSAELPAYWQRAVDEALDICEEREEETETDEA